MFPDRFLDAMFAVALVLLPPVGREYWAACTRMGDCP